MRKFFVLFTLIISTCLVAGDNTDKTFIHALYTKAQLNHASYKLLRELTAQYPRRLAGSPGADGAVQWARRTMQQLGFDRVYLQEIKVPHWERGEAEACYVVFPDNHREKLSVLALGRSVPTPGGELLAPLYVAHDVDDIKKADPEAVKGRIVFFNAAFPDTFLQTMHGYGRAVQKRVWGPSEAARKGAVAVIIRSVTTAHDDAPHTGTLVYAGDAPKVPAAALGYLSADRLYEYWKRNKNIKVSLRINSRIFPDKTSYNVIGELTGRKHPEQIIAIGGHLDAWDVGEGAQDDGAGIVHSIGALALLKQAGYQPQNTIRAVCFMNEENGLRGGKAYARIAKEKKEKHIVAIESDAGGFTPRGFGYSGPEAGLKQLNEWLPLFPPFTIQAIRPSGGGADIGPLHKAMSTPVMSLIPDNQRYFDFHHSHKDVFSAVNRRELELGTASVAALLYLIDQYGLNNGVKHSASHP